MYSKLKKEWNYMNKCFLIGKIIEKGKFKFILNKKVKHKSQIQFKIELSNGSIIDVLAYDRTADYILRKKIDWILIYGRLEQTENGIHVETNEIFNLDWKSFKNNEEKWYKFMEEY